MSTQHIAAIAVIFADKIVLTSTPLFRLIHAQLYTAVVLPCPPSHWNIAGHFDADTRSSPSNSQTGPRSCKRRIEKLNRCCTRSRTEPSEEIPYLEGGVHTWPCGKPMRRRSPRGAWSSERLHLKTCAQGPLEEERHFMGSGWRPPRFHAHSGWKRCSALRKTGSPSMRRRLPSPLT